MFLSFAHFGVFYHRQIILPAKLVRDTAHLSPRTVFFLALIMLGFKGSSSDKIRIIHDDMSVAMLAVGMYCNDILVLFLQQPMTQFLRYLHSLFGGDFVGGERLDYVLCFGGASTTFETFSDGSELFCCSDGVCLAHKRLDKRMTSGLIPVHDVFK